MHLLGKVCLENLDMSSLAPAAALDRLGYNQFSMCTTQRVAETDVEIVRGHHVEFT